MLSGASLGYLAVLLLQEISEEFSLLDNKYDYEADFLILSQFLDNFVRKVLKLIPMIN